MIKYITKSNNQDLKYIDMTITVNGNTNNVPWVHMNITLHGITTSVTTVTFSNCSEFNQGAPTVKAYYILTP